jgi:hypothetical protein
LLRDYPQPESYLTQVRDVPLLPKEKVTHAFLPEDGLVKEPTAAGRLLVTTNQRIISFAQGDRRNETVLVPIEELNGVVVKKAAKSSGSLIQGLLLIAAGLFIYVVVSYWFAGRFDGPEVPFINIDAGPLIILAGLIWGGWLVSRHYFTRGDGSVTFQGSDWAFTFPYAGDKADEEVYRVVNTVFASRAWLNGLYSSRQE